MLLPLLNLSKKKFQYISILEQLKLNSILKNLANCLLLKSYVCKKNETKNT